MNSQRSSSDAKKPKGRATDTVPLPKKRHFTLRLPFRVRLPIPPTVLVATAVAITALFPFAPSVQPFEPPKEGEVAQETIIAPFTFDILKSQEQLEYERRRAIEQTLLVIDFNPEVRAVIAQKFFQLRKAIAGLAGKQISDSLLTAALGKHAREVPENTMNVLIKRPYLLDDGLLLADQILGRGVLTVLLVPTFQKLEDFRSRYNSTFDQHLIYDKSYVTFRRDSVEQTARHDEIPVKEIALDRAITRLKANRRLDQEALNALYALLHAYIQPNVTVNGEETQRRKQRATLEVLPIKGKVIKDTEILRKHQVVTMEVVEQLRSLRESLQRRNSGEEKWKIIGGNAGKLLLTLVALVFLAFFLRSIRPDLMSNSRHLIALSCIVIIQIAVVRGGMLLVPRLLKGTSEISSVIPEYLIPTAIGGILGALLFDLPVSVLISMFVSIYFGIVLGFKHSLFLCSFLGGIMAAFSYRDIRYRWDFFRAMPSIVATYAGFIFLWHLVSFGLSPMEIWQNIGLALINVISATFFAMMLTTVFENLFDISTNMSLLELADMNHPVLKRLSIEAAGTYNHSVLVGNLAESAAEAIGANALLSRVASYYHDIGKIDRADYFIENHFGDKNIHNKLSPNMSALIICSHVKEGVEFARKYKLPRAIRDAIMQHHGTSTVSFFYEKALEQDPHNQVQEEDFRYSGPVPQTRENAVIMLADSVEAASRSLATSSPKLLRELVRKIIRDKYNSHQLDQCDLTLRNLDRIVEGFMPVLQGIFHSRIEYPSK